MGWTGRGRVRGRRHRAVVPAGSAAGASVGTASPAAMPGIARRHPVPTGRLRGELRDDTGRTVHRQHSDSRARLRTSAAHTVAVSAPIRAIRGRRSPIHEPRTGEALAAGGRLAPPSGRCPFVAALRRLCPAASSSAPCGSSPPWSSRTSRRGARRAGGRTGGGRGDGGRRRRRGAGDTGNRSPMRRWTRRGGGAHAASTAVSPCACRLARRRCACGTSASVRSRRPCRSPPRHAAPRPRAQRAPVPLARIGRDAGAVRRARRRARGRADAVARCSSPPRRRSAGPLPHRSWRLCRA